MTASLSAANKNARRDKWIPWYFVAFFVVIAVIDGAFVTIALRTQPGVVTERAYEKGLKYNKIIEEVEKQKKIGLQEKVQLKNGVLTWYVLDKNNLPLQNAQAYAHFMRPTISGHDFTVILKETDKGIFEVRPAFPLPGAWTAKLEIKWQDQRFETAIDLIAP